MSSGNNNNGNNNSPRMQVMGLWKRRTDQGKEYLAGSLGGMRVSVFPNGYKTQDKHPDYVVYIAPMAKKEGNGGGQNNSGGGFPSDDNQGFPSDDFGSGNDFIPF